MRAPTARMAMLSDRHQPVRAQARGTGREAAAFREGAQRLVREADQWKGTGGNREVPPSISQPAGIRVSADSGLAH